MFFILQSLLESSISVIICLKSLLSARTDCKHLKMLKPESACNLTYQIITGHYYSLHKPSSQYGQKALVKAKRSMKPDNLLGSIQMSTTGQKGQGPAKKFKPLLNWPEVKKGWKQSDHLIGGFRTFWNVKEVGVSKVLNNEPKIDLKQANKTTWEGRTQNEVNEAGSWNFNCGSFCRDIILFVIHTFGYMNISQCVYCFSSSNCEVMHNICWVGMTEWEQGIKKWLSVCVW